MSSSSTEIVELTKRPSIFSLETLKDLLPFTAFNPKLAFKKRILYFIESVHQQWQKEFSGELPFVCDFISQVLGIPSTQCQFTKEEWLKLKPKLVSNNKNSSTVAKFYGENGRLEALYEYILTLKQFHTYLCDLYESFSDKDDSVELVVEDNPSGESLKKVFDKQIQHPLGIPWVVYDNRSMPERMKQHFRLGNTNKWILPQGSSANLVQTPKTGIDLLQDEAMTLTYGLNRWYVALFQGLYKNQLSGDGESWNNSIDLEKSKNSEKLLQSILLASIPYDSITNDIDLSKFSKYASLTKKLRKAGMSNIVYRPNGLLQQQQSKSKYKALNLTPIDVNPFFQRVRSLFDDDNAKEGIDRELTARESERVVRMLDRQEFGRANPPSKILRSILKKVTFPEEPSQGNDNLDDRSDDKHEQPTKTPTKNPSEPSVMDISGVSTWLMKRNRNLDRSDRLDTTRKGRSPNKQPKQQQPPQNQASMNLDSPKQPNPSEVYRQQVSEAREAYGKLKQEVGALMMQKGKLGEELGTLQMQIGTAQFRKSSADIELQEKKREFDGSVSLLNEQLNAMKTLIEQKRELLKVLDEDEAKHTNSINNLNQEKTKLDEEIKVLGARKQEIIDEGAEKEKKLNELSTALSKLQEPGKNPVDVKSSNGTGEITA
jgi:hypothetical protein